MNFESLHKKIIQTKNAKLFEIGRSFFSQSIYCLFVGNPNGEKILLSAGIHAREYISSLFLLKLAYSMVEEKKLGIYFLPLLNPDGVRIALDGISWLEKKEQERLTKINKGNDFSLWKANGRGVDLNVNFDALWGQGKFNIRQPSSQNYIGPFANSEPETQSILRFLKELNPEISLSFHSKGEVIYYGFEKYGKNLKNDKKIAKALSKGNGYKIVKTKNSAGGLSDWINLKLKKSAFTIELGEESLTHPIGEKYLNSIYEKNKNCIQIISKFL